jgi:hypothetical protein
MLNWISLRMKVSRTSLRQGDLTSQPASLIAAREILWQPNPNACIGYWAYARKETNR